jgi:hypothetical protein
MASSSPTSPPAAQPPPDLPSMPDVSPTLSDYLRRFSLWCRNGFADKVSATAAIPRIYMLSPLGYVFKISIGDQGRLHSTPVTYGTGADGAPVLTFALVTGTAWGNIEAPAGTSSTTYRMMGLKLLYTPVIESEAVASADGHMANDTINCETDAILVYGSGTPPNNGVAFNSSTMVQMGDPVRHVSGVAGGFAPFSITRVSGAIPLTVPSVTYWVDMAVKAVGGGTSTITNVNVFVRGIP